MNCSSIKERLVDYIDGLMTVAEKVEIENHLKVCEECKNEYKELSDTIDYVKSRGERIRAPKDLGSRIKERFKGKRKRRLIGARAGTVAIALSLIFIITVVAADGLDFIKRWKEKSTERISAAEKLLKNGVGQKLNISTEDDGIRVTAEGVIADDLNTLVILKIEDLEGNTRYIPKDYPIPIKGDIQNEYADLGWLPNMSGTALYSEEENVMRYMIRTNPMNKEEGNIELNISSMQSYIAKDENSIKRKEGQWNLTIPAKKEKSKVYEVDETIDVDGTELIIERITIAPTVTSIDYRYKTYNSEGKYFVDGFDLSIIYKEEKYSRSVLPTSSYGYDKPWANSGGSIGLDSLYLDDPDKFTLVVDGYLYTTRWGRERYEIDWDNLPQTVEYHGAKITIEDVIYNEDSTEIIISEDTSEDREYHSSEITVTAKDNPYIYDTVEVLDTVVKDKDGKIVNLEEQSWEPTMRFYHYKKKLIIENNTNRIYHPDAELYSEELIPEKLYIDALSFSEFPNIQRVIKLK